MRIILAALVALGGLVTATSASAVIAVTNCQIDTNGSSIYSRVYCEVTNTGENAAALLAYEVTVSEKDREVPWEKDNIRMNVSGGLEPRETANLLMYQFLLSDRANLDDLSISITATGYDLDGQEISE